jgi:hypothetical protein
MTPQFAIYIVRVRFNQIRMIRKLFNWIFKSELDKLQKAIDTVENRSFRAEKLVAELEWQKKAFQSILDGIDVSVDVHEYDHRYSPSWAVISLQGQKLTI